MPLPMITEVAPRPTDPGLEEAEPEARTHRRFDRSARLFTEPGLKRLMRSRVVIFGVGGVGSFAAEALARSAVGELCLVDFDAICVTNANRQLHALRGLIGKPKVEVMAERLRQINPVAKVEAVRRFYNAEASEALLEGPIDFAIDAIDNLTAKAHLIASCLSRGIPLVSSMGAAARMDPTRIRVDDLGRTERDPFARALRKILRKDHGLVCSKEEPLGVPAVYSDEPPIAPSALSYDGPEGFLCVCPSKDNGLHTCEHRSRIEGSAAFVTGAFGLTAASVAVKALIAD